MIPLKNLTARNTFPVTTILLIAVNVLVFLYQLSLPPHAGQQFIMTFGMVPARIPAALIGRSVTLPEAFLPLFTSMFLHGGFLHILGNMWFLWIFGADVEDRLGHLTYLLFYLVCGLGSGLTQAIFAWGSKVPAVGASGAISGVLGAFLIMYPGARILTLVPLFIFWFTVRLPAVIFIGFWFLMQFLSGIGSLSLAASGGVAWWAHVGGFLLGIFLTAGYRQKRQSSWEV